MNIQWFPGHMKKTVGDLKKSASMVDFVLELRDARVPYSSANPVISEIFSKKKLVTVLNKSDLADKSINKEWENAIKKEDGTPYFISANSKKDVFFMIESLKKKRTGKSLSNKINIMVVGIPNVGKSTFINTLIKRKGLKTADKPGVTKQIQWIRTDEVNLLDTPGVLWPKFEDEEVGLHLAITNAINGEILDSERLCIEFIRIIKELYPGLLYNKYLTDESPEPYNILESLAEKRGMLLKGGVLNTKEAAVRILSDFRKGNLGKISLERPEDV